MTHLALHIHLQKVSASSFTNRLVERRVCTKQYGNYSTDIYGNNKLHNNTCSITSLFTIKAQWGFFCSNVSKKKGTLTIETVQRDNVFPPQYTRDNNEDVENTTRLEKGCQTVIRDDKRLNNQDRELYFLSSLHVLATGNFVHNVLEIYS